MPGLLVLPRFEGAWERERDATRSAADCGYGHKARGQSQQTSSSSAEGNRYFYWLKSLTEKFNQLFVCLYCTIVIRFLGHFQNR